MKTQKCLAFIISIALLINVNSKAFSLIRDTTIKVAEKAVVIAGEKQSNVLLTNYAGKKIGIMPTYFFSDNEKVVISVFYTSKEEGVYLAIIQTIKLNTLKGKKVKVSVKKAFVNPEMNTSPKQYWDVSIDIREANNDVSTTGETKDVRSNGQKAEIQKYEGVNNLIPFVTQKEAQAFATKLQQILAKASK